MRKIICAIALSVALISLTGCATGPGTGVRAEPKSTKLQKAYDECAPGATVELADGNSSILINGATATEDITDIACLMLQLNTPEYIVAEMDNTTALMGRQHEEEDGISYEWSYHPDNGFDMIMHED